MMDLASQEACGAGISFVECRRTTEVIMGARNLQNMAPAINALRRRCGQEDDFTTDPRYFIAANTLKHRRVAAVLIHREGELEACVLFFEHCRLGMGLGVFRGGDGIGESLVAGREPLRVQYVHLATQALLHNWRIHGVSLVMMAPVGQCIGIMESHDTQCMFAGRNIQRKLALAPSYRSMLSSMGHRTRRSLAGKRQQLERSSQIQFVPSLDLAEARDAMLKLRPRSYPPRTSAFYYARCKVVAGNPDFFCMGIRLPNGVWLSVLSGWRRNQVTYVDLQMNDMHRKKESLSAVMRAYLLEHEINRGQQLISFVGGTSLLLRRYCHTIEPCTHAFVWRPCLRATLFKLIVPHLQPRSVYQRVQC